MVDYNYIFHGRVVPERAMVSVGELQFAVASDEDVPAGTLSIEIILSQIGGRFATLSEVQNIFTLRNIVEDAVRGILDVVGYREGYGYDVEITQVMRGDNSQKFVLGIDIPALKGLVTAAGIDIADVFRLLARPDGFYLRHALADVREAIRSPRDTGFFCYRAIESLKNACAAYHAVRDAGEAWEIFRTTYGISRDDIMEVKKLADPARHGDIGSLRGPSDAQRAHIFTVTWGIINAYVLKERGAA